MGAASAVGVDDDLAAGEAGVAVRAADDEFSGGVDVEDDVIVPELFGNARADDLLDDLALGLFADGVLLLVDDGSVMLGGDDDGVDADGLFVFVGDGDL